jgi:hypothetical protein|tara:strand:- start:414 stop:569 length:156 start_codon:yes stop_codon:yes gene_type:complete
MTDNNTPTDGELNQTTNKNILENGGQALISTPKINAKDSFYRSLEAFSDCV